MLRNDAVTGQASDVFSFRSGRPALDFAATLMFRGGPTLELLTGPDALARWAVAAGLVDGDLDGPPARVSTAVALREAIYRSGLATIAGRRPTLADVDRLNAVAAQPPVVLGLTPEGALRRSASPPQVLSTIARDAIDLLGGSDAPRLRQCGRDGCTRLFLDRSRGGNRLWCGMKECGNRVNAAAYRARRRSA